MINRKISIWALQDEVITLEKTYYPDDYQSFPFYLAHLAREFDSTEINTSFYRLPEHANRHHWIKAVPHGFKFCPKMSRYLTQMKELNDPEEHLAHLDCICHWIILSPLYSAPF